MRFNGARLSLVVGLLLLSSALAGDVPSGMPVTVQPGSEELKVGSRCRVELKAVVNGWNETTVVCEGKLTRSTRDGVGLIVTEQRTTVVKRTALAKLPGFERLFRNVGIGRPSQDESKETWLPSEKIHSVRLLEGSADVPSDPRLKVPNFPAVN